MPVLPEFIPLTKQKEMFAVSSWRDSPQASATAASGTSHLGMPSPAALPVSQCEKDGAVHGKAHRSRRGRGRGKTRSPQRQQDVDDFFVNCVLPLGVTFKMLKSELDLHVTTPLRVYDVGPPCTLYPRRNGAAWTGGTEVGGVENNSGVTPTTTTTTTTTTAAMTPPAAAAVAATTTTTTTPTPVGHTAEVAPGSKTAPAKKLRQAAVEISPFRTPMVTANAAAAAAAEDGDELPGASLPDLALPPSVPSDILMKGHLISLLFAESSEAEKVSELILKKWPASTVMIVSRNRSALNASLVLKGFPSLAKTERVIEVLENVIPNKMSYIRLHRGERGVFKNVMFVKYPNREIAEECKLRLERFFIGSRPLKVEFKKKERGVAVEREKGLTLQQLVRDLRVSTEHEGFVYQRSDLSKEEVKALKQLCHSYGLSFDLGEQTVTVRRILPGSGRPSPAIRPSTTASTLQSLNWTQPTPGALRPMDFKGIRHWRELNSHCVSLGIARPKGPGDVPPFAAGRGRPL